MKIAIVSPYPPSKGTLNEYAFHLIKQFKFKHDIEEIIILTDKIDETYTVPESESTCKVTIKAIWSFNALSNIYNIAKAVKACEADVVLYNIQFLSFGDKKIQAAVGLMTPLLTRILGVPSVVLLHNIVETVNYESAGITNNPVMKFLYTMVGTILTRIVLMANLVAVTMPKYVDILEKKYKCKNVALIPHGSFELPPLPNFELADGPKKIMTFGKFGTYKKVEKMIEAVEMVRKSTGQDLEIVIAGTDNPNVAGYLDSVKEKYSHVPKIKFTGYVEEEDVPKIFTESAVVVFEYTSTTGSSGVLHQAGSYGKAVVLPNIGDLKELIEEEGYCGEFFKANDVNDLAKAIKKLVVDDAHRQTLAKKNYTAAASLPMSDIADWYMMHFNYLKKKNHFSKPSISPLNKSQRIRKTNKPAKMATNISV